ncbi:MAG: TRAP transporter substrate-binding protein [Oscillospiraceae bacterium]
MKKLLSVVLVLALAVSLCAGLTGCGDSGDADADKVYEFNLSMHDASTTPSAVYIQSWIDKVYEATDGHVKITLHDNSTLCAATDIGVNVTDGAVDIGWLYTSYYAGQFPLSDVINLPFQGFGDPVVSTEVLWDLYDEYEEVRSEWAGYKLLMLYGNPGMMFASSDSPITSVADLAGRSMRCPSGAITDLLTAWKASPITMAPPDIYEAIEKNNISGYVFEPSGIVNFSLQEVTKYYTDLPMYDGPFGLIMNLDAWNSLPAEYQEIIEGLSGREASIGAAEAFAAAVEAARETITAAGGEFVSVSDEAMAEFAVEADKYAASWADGRSADGFDGAAYLARAKELAAKYGE